MIKDKVNNEYIYTEVVKLIKANHPLQTKKQTFATATQVLRKILERIDFLSNVYPLDKNESNLCKKAREELKSLRIQEKYQVGYINFVNKNFDKITVDK